VEFILDAPSARRVELMADFTDWAPVDMAPVGAGRWRLTIPVSSGLYHVNVRYDGGSWRSPPGTRKVRDEFDRETGVVVVD
jgi:1,4-alpha-glucan branching enzyme